jgi:SAM-dependent methyltransferase
MAYFEDDPAYIEQWHLRRNKLLSGISIEQSHGVEIGPLCRPFVRRSDGPIVYVDFTDAATLKQKYKDDPFVDTARIVDIDAIWGSSTLQSALGDRQFDYLVASHVIEHVPDFIGWLREVGSVLKPTGEVRLIVPDKRFTFDFFRRKTELSDILHSYIRGARIPQPHSLLDFCLRVVPTKIDPWTQRPNPAPSDMQIIHGAMHTARETIENGTYHDVHCWVFTPRSFAGLMSEVTRADLVDFACEGFVDTGKFQNEFFVSMRRSRDREYIAKSWDNMARLAADFDPNERFWRLRREVQRLTRRREPVGTRMPATPSPLDPVVPLIFPEDFDPEAYLQANEDVRLSGSDPVVHFRHCGWLEGRPRRP